jgi:hypothetical protein
MAKSTQAKPKDDPRLTRVGRICLDLSETSRQRHGSHAAFLVRRKTSAYYLDDHHGDGIVAITCKVAPGDNQLLARRSPNAFTCPLISLPKAGLPSGWIAPRSIGKRFASCFTKATGALHRSGWRLPFVWIESRFTRACVYGHVFAKIPKLL